MKTLMKSVVMACVLGLGVAAFAAPQTAADKAAAEKAKQEKAKKDALLKELGAIVSANSMGHGTFNCCFLKYYCPTELGPDVTACTDAEWAEMKAKCLTALKEAYELDPSVGREVAYAGALHYLKRYAEALPLYKDAMDKLRAQKNPDARTLGWGLFSYAECQYVTGDAAGAWETLRDLRKRNYNFGRGGSPSGEADTVLAFVENRIADYDWLPRFTGAKAFPEPQKAAYEEKFTEIPDIAIRTSGMDDDDPRFGFFEQKLTRRGVAFKHVGVIGSLFSFPSFTLEIEVGGEAPAAFAALKDFQKREAYEIAVGEKGAVIKAATKQGALWGLVTFIQMMDAEKKAIRRGTVTDWPDTAERGFLSTSTWAGCPEYTLMCKFNNVDFQGHIARGYKFTPLRVYALEKMSEFYVKHGLSVYYGMCDLTMCPNMPLCSPRTLEIQADFCRTFAKMGAGVYYPYDDCRYPMNLEDQRKYKIGKNIDADHIDKLYRTVAKDYPDFKLIFCPPFYWGPDSNADGYCEDREEYLASLKKIHPAVEFYWTGPMVKSFDMTKRQVKWFADLTGRKPTIFQNGMDVHRYTTNYGIDAFDFAAWHYPEYYEDIAIFHVNSHFPLDASRDTTVAEGLWNPKAFQGERAAKRGNQMLCGEKAYDLMLPGLKAMEYFDKYRARSLPVDIIYENPTNLQEKIDIAKESCRKVSEYMKSLPKHPCAGLGHYFSAPSWAEEILRAVKNPPDTLGKYKADIAQVARQANEEVGVDAAKGDILLTPATVTGGNFFVYDNFDPGKGRVGATKAFDHPIPKRLVRCLRGKGVPSDNTLSFPFECDPFPPTGDYTMYVNGMDDEAAGENTLEISLNGKVVGTVQMGFPQATGYAVKTFKIPFTSMKRNNQVSIRNVTPGSNPRGTPWLMINYIVLKKAAK